MRTLLLWIAIAGCSRASSRDALAPVARTAVAPPHESIYVTTKRGLLRVFLDSGRTEVVDPAPGALLGAAGATVHKRERRFAVAREGRAIEIDGLVSDDRPMLSPDRTRFAVRSLVDDRLVAVRPEIAVVGLADRKVRRYPVDAVSAITGWTADGKALVIATPAGARRLELATGALGDAPPEPAREIACAAKGRRLELERDPQHQRIVLYPIARAADPETIEAVEPRTLVAAPPSATSASDALFGGALGHVAFTRSCDHFVFAFGGRIYVGDVATGRYAYVVAGDEPITSP